MTHCYFDKNFATVVTYSSQNAVKIHLNSKTCMAKK